MEDGSYWHQFFQFKAYRGTLTINQSDADCVIMHWVGNDTISIRELGLITKPIVWRLADMWAFSGCKHYSEDFELERLEKYPQNSDKNIDRLIWEEKKILE